MSARSRSLQARFSYASTTKVITTVSNTPLAPIAPIAATFLEALGLDVDEETLLVRLADTPPPEADGPEPVFALLLLGKYMLVSMPVAVALPVALPVMAPTVKGPVAVQ